MVNQTETWDDTFVSFSLNGLTPLRPASADPTKQQNEAKMDDDALAFHPSVGGVAALTLP